MATVSSLLSGRIAELRPTAVNAILAEVRQLQAEGRSLVSLMRGEPDFETPPHIVDAAVRALAAVRGMRYLDDAGRARTIDVALKPWLLTSEQMFYFHHVARTLSEALLRVAHLHARVPAVRQIVRFGPQQEAWLRLCAHPTAHPLAVIGRLDSTANYDHARWRADFRMLEPNTVGVGGVHYAPAGCSILLDVLEDVLTAAFPGRAITATPDPRQLLVEELRAVARRLCGPAPRCRP